MNINEANDLVARLKPSNEELAILLEHHLDIKSLASLDPETVEHYRLAASMAAVIMACAQVGKTLDFELRPWIVGEPPYIGRLALVQRLTGLKEEIGYPAGR